MIPLFQFVSFQYQNIDFSCTGKYQTYNQTKFDDVTTPNLQSYVTLQHSLEIKNKKVKKIKKLKLLTGLREKTKLLGGLVTEQFGAID